MPRAWGSGLSGWNQGADFFGEGTEAEAARIPPGRVGAFSESLPIPADASGAYRPNPQAKTKLAPRPSSRVGYDRFLFSIDKII